MPHLDIENLSAAYGTTQVLRDVSLSVERGEVVGLIGPSGSGKSTLLRVLIGLTPPTAGQVRFDGAVVDYRSRASVHALRERMAIVFQQYNLFQNMNVLRNLTLAPVEVQKRLRAEVEADAMRILARVGLADKQHARPSELSGGQQQRVAIARALALHPQVLLLDEVTSALDPELVQEVLDTIQALAQDGMTLLIVSHEMSFVRQVADRVVMMDAGRIVETGSPTQIFSAPREQRTQTFIGTILRHS